MRSPRGTPDLLREGELSGVMTVDTPQAALALLGGAR
jgi:hypothetical protein